MFRKEYWIISFGMFSINTGGGALGGSEDSMMFWMCWGGSEFGRWGVSFWLHNGFLIGLFRL